MDEKSLIRQWNQMRLQIIQAQVAPALVLIGVMVLATISQYAAVREGEALIADLGKVDKPSALARTIAGSRGLVSLSAIAIVAFDIAMFALVVWAVLGN